MKDHTLKIIVGVVVGVAAILLTRFGNPANMGFCIACFLRDTAGAIGFHKAAVVQYARPEIMGIVLGAFIVSLFRKEFTVKGGSSVMTRFFVGIAVMIGALIFLGCPLRAMIRLGGGDMNAVVGILGFIAGIYVATLFLKRGFSLGKSHKVKTLDGVVFPGAAMILLGILLFIPSLLVFSEKGPGAAHAPMLLSLGVGLVVGGVSFFVRLCFVGGFRDSIMLKKFDMLIPYVMVALTVLIGNLIYGTFQFGFDHQPIAHTDWLWNFLGLGMVGFGSALVSGCPFKQLLLAGSGNVDAAVTVLGMIAGAAIAHNFGLAASPKGVPFAGKIAYVALFACLLVIAFVNTKRANA